MRLRLFTKYAFFISTLVVGLLAVSWALILSIANEESIRHLRGLQTEKANLAASRIGQFLRDVDLHVSWVDLIDEQSQQPVAQLRRIELLKLLIDSEVLILNYLMVPSYWDDGNHRHEKAFA